MVVTILSATINHTPSAQPNFEEHLVAGVQWVLLTPSMAAWCGCDHRTVDCSSHRRQLLWQPLFLEQVHSSGCTFDWLNVCRDCAGTALGLCWDCAGTVLGLCWDCAGTVLGLCWDLLGLCLDCVGTVLGLRWDWVGTGLGLCWDCVWTALEPCWDLLGLRWDCAGTELGLCWDCAETVLELHWDCGGTHDPSWASPNSGLGLLWAPVFFTSFSDSQFDLNAFREQRQTWMMKRYGPSLRRCKERLSPHSRILFEEPTVFQAIKIPNVSWKRNVNYPVHNSWALDCILK